MTLFQQLRLYLVTDSFLSKGRTPQEVVSAAIQGGVTCVQLREKSASGKTFLETAQALQPLLKKQAIPFIVNDRIDIALAVNADGIHLGQSDIPLSLAQQLFPNKIIGITVHTAEEAKKAEKEARKRGNNNDGGSEFADRANARNKNNNQGGNNRRR